MGEQRTRGEDLIVAPELGLRQIDGRQVHAAPSPNFDDQAIKVEYVVLHYTGVSLTKTLQIFSTPKLASAHLVIDHDGEIYECVACLGAQVFKAWHAGRSRLKRARQRLLESFNGCAVGIELVNFNGNIFPYTEPQYAALLALLRHFRTQHPALGQASSLLGHQDVAGFRGKIDPGLCFDWARVEREIYGQGSERVHKAPISKRLQKEFRALYSGPTSERLADDGDLAAELSLLCESAARLARRGAESEQPALQQRFAEQVAGLQPQLSTDGQQAAQRLLERFRQGA